MFPIDPAPNRTGMTPQHVLVVDDETDIRELLVLTLMRMGIEAVTASTREEAFGRLGERTFDLCLTDMRLPDGDGLEILRHIAEHHGNTPVAVITAFGSTENAVAALKAGAFDYIAKPIQLKQLREVITAALNLPRTQATNERGRRGAQSARVEPEKERRKDTAEAHANAGPRLLGHSQPIQRAREMIEKLARSQAPVYLTGESGTGKEVAARRIHQGSARRDKPFVAVNCGAIPENLMESEFFGYRKGAFTGAESDREGYFQAVNGGTLFLDEVGDLPLPMQVKLLRVIQEKTVRRLGDTAEQTVDFRIISATHQNLHDKVQAGEFRQDLFYRLNVIELKMPSLREIPEDIPDMAAQILSRVSRPGGAAHPTLTDAAVKALGAYDFPGNVRELENILERAVALCEGDTIGAEDLYLTPAQTKGGAGGATLPPGERKLPLHEYLDQIEREQIMKALEQTRFNKTAAAKVLGITFRSLRYRLDRLGIE
jgi:two-component system response regulator PilR (NtrC family)